MLTSLLIYRVGRVHISEKAGLYAGLFYLASIDLLYGFSVLGEIDLFYSLITSLSFLAFYHYASLQRWWLAFALLYGLNALGVLTKGLPSFLFAGLTALSWLLYTRDWRRLWSLAHIAGIALFVLVVGLYFWSYSQYNSLEQYFVTPRVQTIARNHFQCQELIGARLAQDFSACIGSHWHERDFFSHLLPSS